MRQGSGDKWTRRYISATKLYPTKRPSTKYVYLPAMLGLVKANGSACLRACIACQIRPASALRRVSSIGPQKIKRLAYGDGVPLKVFLSILRYARPYSGTPIHEGELKHLFNSMQQYTVSELASAWNTIEKRSDDEPAARATRRAISSLRTLGLMEVIEYPGHPSFYVPHAREGNVRIPQYIWGQQWVQKLDGMSLLLLLALLARTHMPPRELDVWWTKRSHAFRRYAERGMLLQDYAVLDELPASRNTRRKALDELKKHGLALDFRTRRRRFIAVREP